MATLNKATLNKTVRQVRVAAVQMQSRLGQVETNLRHATPLVEQAARQGAQLVVLPELSASGYSMSKAVWDGAETREGPTTRWLRETSGRLGIYLGIGFVEADGTDFFNTYALGAPDGQIAGYVRKTMAETYCFRCATGSHVVDTAIGRIGVGICADNHFVPMVRLMQAQSVDLMLMPHAWPGPFKAGGAVSQADIDGAYAKACDMAPLYTRLLGVPAIFTNHVGPRGAEKWAGIMGSMMNPEKFHLLGLSTIADCDGTVKGRLDDRAEGVIVADVTLDPARKVGAEPACYGVYGGGWVDAGSSGNAVRDILCGVDAFFTHLSYALSAERRRKARAVSSTGQIRV
ncbi:MAG: carbon-nitrogen hydrolase family protein [Chloroflexi bacterium]|nr:carbon-nitrogen hydrolase family protein [Chloroflexota bacterium]